MNLREWYTQRGPDYVWRRAGILLDRYGLSPRKARARLTDCVEALAAAGCSPTFPTPGRVVRTHAGFFRELQARGTEIAVHGYDHISLAESPIVGIEQLQRAAEAFQREGIDAHGFRCPYLSCTDDLVSALPTGLFAYSSNRAVWWDVVPDEEHEAATSTLDVLRGFYRPHSADETLCTPRQRFSVLEIPVSLPDDLQLHDGLGWGATGLAQAWCEILRRTHRRGEVFVLQFHPEIADLCQPAFSAVLAEAAKLRPRVWVARLQDIAAWWREKSSYRVDLLGGEIHLRCDDRATVLARGLDVGGGDGEANPYTWGHLAFSAGGTVVEGDGRDRASGGYYRLHDRVLRLPTGKLPFVGLAAGAPQWTTLLLSELGYIVELGERAQDCATYLDGRTLQGVRNEIELVSRIEAAGKPMLRYGPWPDGAQSAVSITGDLDALSLVDYTYRLFVKQRV